MRAPAGDSDSGWTGSVGCGMSEGMDGGLLRSRLSGRSPSVVLLAVASKGETAAVLRGLGVASPGLVREWERVEAAPGVDLVQTGIGKSNAAAAVARRLDPSRHAVVLSVGIGGVLPGSAVRVGQVVVASAAVYADEGLETPEGFSDCDAMGFPLADFKGSAVPVSAEVAGWLGPIADAVGPVATVSTCSGTDERAREVARRTGALAEAMEGAAVALTALRLGVPAGEVRVMSNTTGDRKKQRWDVALALGELSRVIGQL